MYVAIGIEIINEIGKMLKRWWHTYKFRVKLKSTSLSWIKTVFVANLKQPKPKLASKKPFDEGDFCLVGIFNTELANQKK